MTDWDNAYKERARLLFEHDGYDVAYRGSVKTAYEAYTKAQADVLVADAERVKAVSRALSSKTDGALGPRPTRGGNIFVGDFPPLPIPPVPETLVRRTNWV